MLAIKTLPKFAENIRRVLAEKGLIDNAYVIKKSEGYVYIPVKDNVANEDIPHAKLVEAQLSKRESKPRKISDVVGIKGIRAFDTVGDIAIIEIPDQHKALENKVGEAILKLHKNIKTVVAKDSSVQGEYRIRNVRHVAGEKKTITIHKEHGCMLKVDVSKVYFSPRLSHERLRIADQVKDGEHILALFAGVAPFPIVIAKRRKVIAYSIELNPVGHKYALENIKMNKVSDKVIAIEGDVNEVLKDKKFDKWADRIIMPLPKDAITFLPNIVHTAKKGCIIHLYLFADKNELMKMKKKVIELVGRECKILLAKKVRTYSPNINQYVFDIKVL